MPIARHPTARLMSARQASVDWRRQRRKQSGRAFRASGAAEPLLQNRPGMLSGNRASLAVVRWVLALTVTFWAVPAAAVPVISIEPSLTTVLQGTDFTLAVNIGTADPSPIDDVSDLFAFQLTVNYPAILAVLSVDEGPFLAAPPGTGNFFSGDTSTVGVISFIFNSLNAPAAGVSGAGTLFTVRFSATSPGLGVVEAIIDPANTDGLEDSQGQPIAAITEPGAVTVLPRVPEPATLLLLGAGVAAFSRRRHVIA
jgi:hypothetical protein